MECDDGTQVQETTFDLAIECTKGVERDLLFGNGFSIAAHEPFNYKRLLERAEVPDDVRAIFAAARTSNFEAVMRVLIAESAGGSPEAAVQQQHKIEALQDALVRAIHEVHPTRRTCIGDQRWERCEEFLEHFIGRRGRGGRIFTTNYDLLLSWAIAPDRDRIRPKKRFKDPYEGFAGGTYGGRIGNANVIYLHGALHLFMKGSVERQRQHRGTGVALHEQIARQLEQGELPIFVSEGASSLKEPKGPGFLKDALDAFKGTCRARDKKALFTLGHGLGVEDAHILGNIPKGSISTVYLGAFGKSEMAAFRPIAESWVAARPAKSPLKVYIFDSTDVVWGPPMGAAGPGLI